MKMPFDWTWAWASDLSVVALVGAVNKLNFRHAVNRGRISMLRSGAELSVELRRRMLEGWNEMEGKGRGGMGRCRCPWIFHKASRLSSAIHLIRYHIALCFISSKFMAYFVFPVRQMRSSGCPCCSCCCCCCFCFCCCCCKLFINLCKRSVGLPLKLDPAKHSKNIVQLLSQRTVEKTSQNNIIFKSNKDLQACSCLHLCLKIISFLLYQN